MSVAGGVSLFSASPSALSLGLEVTDTLEVIGMPLGIEPDAVLHGNASCLHHAVPGDLECPESHDPRLLGMQFSHLVGFLVSTPSHSVSEF